LYLSSATMEALWCPMVVNVSWPNINQHVTWGTIEASFVDAKHASKQFEANKFEVFASIIFYLYFCFPLFSISAQINVNFMPNFQATNWRLHESFFSCEAGALASRNDWRPGNTWFYAVMVALDPWWKMHWNQKLWFYVPGIRGSSPQKSESTSLRWAAPFNCCAKWERFGKIIDSLGARIGAFWNGSFLSRLAEMGMENLPLPYGARRSLLIPLAGLQVACLHIPMWRNHS
jgi:hypothetical protein